MALEPPSFESLSVLEKISLLKQNDEQMEKKLQEFKVQLQSFGQLQQRVEDLAAAISQQGKPIEEVPAIQKGMITDSAAPRDNTNQDRNFNIRLLAVENRELEHRVSELEKRLAEASSLLAGMTAGQDSNAPQNRGSSSPPSALSVIEASAFHDGNEAEFVQKSTARVHNDYDNCQPLPEEFKFAYKLGTSIWDAFLFVGLPTLDSLSTFLLSFLMLVNVLVQLVFCIICWAAFAVPNIDDATIFGLQIWRWNSAHDVINVNELWPVSLASRVCESDGSLPLSYGQVSVLNALRQYQPVQAATVGELMCIVCLLCFWTSLWEDAVETLQLAQGVFCLRGALTRLLMTNDGFRFECIGPLRIAMMAVIVCLKVIILVNVCLVGTIWLASMISLEDLLLNVLALQLVITLDNLLFTSLAPRKAKFLMENCAPLLCMPLPWSTLGAISIFSALPLVYVLLIRDTVDFVTKAAETLCGGLTNFAYSVDPFGIVYVHDNMASSSDFRFTKEGYDVMDARILALNEAMAGKSPEEWQYAFREPDLAELKRKSSENPYTLAEKRNPNCEDLLTDASPRKQVLPLRAALRAAAANMSIDLCPSVGHYCYGNEKINMLARIMCPITCGCDNPTGGTALSGHQPQQLACPLACIHRRVAHLAEMDTCEEAEVANTTMWPIWLQEVEQRLPDISVQDLQKHGCRALQNHSSARELCTGEISIGYDSVIKPFAPLCPLSCGCKKRKHDEGYGCPETCFPSIPWWARD